MAALENDRFRQIPPKETSSYPGYRDQNREILVSQINSLKKYSPEIILTGLLVFGLEHQNEALNFIDSLRKQLSF